jgi:antirestriction protein ArdC
LWAAAQAKGYERGEWGTYQQWQERGAQVRKGEKATLVVFWKFANNAADSQDGEEQASNSGSRLLFTRGYSVFNAAQVDGYTAKPDADTPIEQRIETAEQFFGGINARVIHLGNRAFYSPADDAITLPPLQRSSLRLITTAPVRTKQATGLPARAGATENWGNASGITPTALRNWLLN